ncbi:MAG: PEGA domain-containing protein [Myxococcota bacterium]|jgi:hypothetical protein
MRRGTSGHLSRWATAAVLFAADLAHAAGSLASRPRGTACCSGLCTIVLALVFRQGGVSWPLSFGVALLPGVFGWFVWRAREQFSTGIRVFALVLAVLQILFFVAGVVAAIALPRFVQTCAAGLPGVSQDEEYRPPGEALPFDDPNDSLGLHPEGTVDSEPPGAQVFINDVPAGVTPLRTRFNAGEKTSVRLELDGYFPVTRRVEVNAKQHLALSVVLDPGARVEVATEPPGAAVRVDGGVVLAATPGATKLLPVGPTELVVALPGYVAERRALDLQPGAQGLAVRLSPGVRVPVASTPPGASVWLDGVLLGVTPLDVYVPKKGKHTVELSLTPLTPAKRTLEAPKEDQALNVKLVDQALAAAERRVAQAQAAYDKVNARLEKLQASYEVYPTPAMEKKMAAAEREMEKAAAAVEKAEAALARLREERRLEMPVEPPAPE